MEGAETGHAVRIDTVEARGDGACSAYCSGEIIMLSKIPTGKHVDIFIFTSYFERINSVTYGDSPAGSVPDPEIL